MFGFFGAKTMTKVDVSDLSKALTKEVSAKLAKLLDTQMACAGATFEDAAATITRLKNDWSKPGASVDEAMDKARSCSRMIEITNRNLETDEGEDVYVDAMRIGETFAELAIVRMDLIADAIKTGAVTALHDFTPLMVVATAAAVAIEGEDAMDDLAETVMDLDRQAKAA